MAHLIVDTGLYGSADDAGALATANAMQDNGQVRILGVVVNYPRKWGHGARLRQSRVVADRAG